MLKRIPILAFALLLLWQGQARAQLSDQASLTLVHVSDTQEMEGNWGRGGLAAVSGLIEDLYGSDDLVVLTHGGGALSPSILSYFDRGRHMIDLLNRSGVTVMGLASSEFDFGPEVLLQRVSEARFPILGSNLRFPGGRPLEGVLRNWMLDYRGYKIGFYALVSPRTKDLSSPGETVFLDPVETAAAEAAALREEGADLVIAFANLAESSYERIFDAGHTDIILGKGGGDLFFRKRGGRLYLRVPPGAEEVALLRIDLAREAVEVVTGEGDQQGLEELDLENLGENADPAALEEALTELMQLTEVRFELRAEFNVETRSLLDYDPDPVMKAAVQYYHFNIPKSVSLPVAEVGAAFETSEQEARSRENAFGDLVADALREAADAEIALVNAGYIRGNRRYEAGDILTWRSLVEELPFPNRVVGLQLKGKQILKALENSVGLYERRSGRFLQVSGLEVTYDVARPAGQRVVSVTLGGEPLNSERLYKVAVPEFLANGGDGYGQFAYAKPYSQGARETFVIEALSDYLKTRSPISPGVTGRISFVN